MSLVRYAFQTCICSLIAFNSFFVLYLMCCFGNNPIYVYGFPTNKNSVLFCSYLSPMIMHSSFTKLYNAR